MPTRDERQQQILAVLREQDDWMTASDLRIRLDLSTRSIREYVQQINGMRARDLVESGQNGYRLNRAEHRRRRDRVAGSRRGTSREGRIYTVVRRMIADDHGADVFALAEELHVSPSTIEADLGRARQLLRDYDLQIVRNRDSVSVHGSERQKRRLVRALLFRSGSGLTEGLTNLPEAMQKTSLRTLHVSARGILAQCEIDVNEYALNDILVHLAVAAERVAGGHVTESASSPDDFSEGGDDPYSRAVAHLDDAMLETYGLRLPRSERSVLRSMLITHGNTAEHRRLLDARLPIATTRRAVREVSAQFGLDLYDEATITRLALHVQGLINRSRAGGGLDSPLGISFRATHPLLHEVALAVARSIESDTDITVSDGEIDFLAFHLGNHVQRQLQRGQPVTITCVIPHYGTFHHDIPQRLSAALGEDAVIQDVVTSLVDDWTQITADIVVSVVALPPQMPATVILVSPFMSERDVSSVVSRVAVERERIRREKLHASVVSLFDERLFARQPVIADKHEAIRALGEKLRAAGYVDADFETDVVDREQRSSTAFGGRFAIPHSMYMDAEKTGIAVLLLDQGIPWGPSAAVQLVLMFAVSPEGRATFRDVLDELTRVLSEPGSIEHLVSRSADHSTFVRALVAMLADEDR